MSRYLLKPLDGAFERVRRADEHLTDLKQRIGKALKAQEDSIGIHFDPNPPYTFKLTQPTSTNVHMIIGILIGEICYNLRSALDYLVFELSKLDSGQFQDGTQFPIEDAEKSFSHRIKRGWLKGINSAHIAAIERLQPYNGCNWTKILRDISNPDKHRQFVHIWGNGRADGYTRADGRFDSIHAPIRRAPHPAGGEMDVKIHFSSTIEFANNEPILETLDVIKLKVSETLEVFKPEF